ncbi:putative Transposable element Tc1 transposase-like 43 [Homarus americanus]|uniref:Putative Transposable element Tc1 transposase-like 43 n=1 Tax=Homarus americanus TaxID=6706 RepID=A0A8J5JY89_HOMAM|nr:putative Transposable element Tc1 transposase-like 43 [Homarus americanus]
MTRRCTRRKRESITGFPQRLTAEHRAGRLANQHVGEGFDFWSRVVFTDEKTFSSSNHGRLHVWTENSTSCIHIVTIKVRHLRRTSRHDFDTQSEATHSQLSPRKSE